MSCQMVPRGGTTISDSLCRRAPNPIWRGHIRPTRRQAMHCAASNTQQPDPIGLPPHGHITRRLANSVRGSAAAFSLLQYGPRGITPLQLLSAASSHTWLGRSECWPAALPLQSSEVTVSPQTVAGLGSAPSSDQPVRSTILPHTACWSGATQTMREEGGPSRASPQLVPCRLNYLAWPNKPHFFCNPQFSWR